MLFLLSGPGPIHSLSFQDSQGHTVQLSDFRGKKILFVNTASGSSSAAQYARLEQLYQQFKDSLVIVAFPSNDFGHEEGSDSAIRQWVGGTYSIHFILASKTKVSGAGQNEVYRWLTQSALNGTDSNPVGNDFYKFLIDEKGFWMGVFSDQVDPLSPQMLDAIRTQEN
jgi:glutathione peroxidase